MRLYDYLKYATPDAAKAYARRGGEALYVEYTIGSLRVNDPIPSYGTLYDRDRDRLNKVVDASGQEFVTMVQIGVLHCAFFNGEALERMIKEAKECAS